MSDILSMQQNGGKGKSRRCSKRKMDTLFESSEISANRPKRERKPRSDIGPSVDQATLKEEAKRLERMRRNRESAARTRNRRRAESDKLQKTIDRLEGENLTIKSEMRELRRQLNEAHGVIKRLEKDTKSSFMCDVRDEEQPKRLKRRRRRYQPPSSTNSPSLSYKNRLSVIHQHHQKSLSNTNQHHLPFSEPAVLYYSLYF